MVSIYLIFEFHETTKGFEFSCPRISKQVNETRSQKKRGFYLKLTVAAKPRAVSFNFFS